MQAKYDSGMYDKAFFDVELRIFRNLTTGGFQVALRTWLDDEVYQDLPTPPPELIGPAPEQRLECRSYGMMLYEWLFRGRLQHAFERARWSSPSRSSFAGVTPEGGMRFSVALAEDLPAEFANVRWEALHAPDGYLPLSMGAAFTRLIRVRARASRPLPPTPTRILLLRSEPADLGALGLPPFDPQLWEYTDSVKRRPWGKMMHLTTLGPTVMLAEARDYAMKGHQVVYVMAHTQANPKETRLMMADPAGQAEVVPEEIWVDCLAPADGPVPTLVYLATPPESFAPGVTPFAGATLRLLRAGVRAVITLQGPVDPPQLARFNESFFNTLLQSGLVDVAVAAARYEMLDPDQSNTWSWTYPVLTVRTPVSTLFAAAA